MRKAFETDAQGAPAVSRAAFGDLGRAEISAAFRAAFFAGLRAGGVEVAALDDDEEAELKAEVRAERRYWTALANALYREALPRRQYALQVLVNAEARRDPEERARLQQRADEVYGEFRRARDDFLRRIDLWVNKGLKRIFDSARLYAQGNTMKRWVLGRTEQHCITCLAASGQVHRAKSWRAVGILPRTDALVCGGFVCDCELVDAPGARAQGRLDRIPVVAGKGRYVYRRDADGDGARDAGGDGETAPADIGFGFWAAFPYDPALAAVREALAERAPAEMAWTPPGEWHLSLCYAAAPQPEDARAGFEALALPFAPVVAPAHGLAVWATEQGNALVMLLEPTPALCALQMHLCAQFAAQSIPVSDHTRPEAWTPHVTLAYGAPADFVPRHAGHILHVLPMLEVKYVELVDAPARARGGAAGGVGAGRSGRGDGVNGRRTVPDEPTLARMAGWRVMWNSVRGNGFMLLDREGGVIRSGFLSAADAWAALPPAWREFAQWTADNGFPPALLFEDARHLQVTEAGLPLEKLRALLDALPGNWTERIERMDCFPDGSVKAVTFRKRLPCGSCCGGGGGKGRDYRLRPHRERTDAAGPDRVQPAGARPVPAQAAQRGAARLALRPAAAGGDRPAAARRAVSRLPVPAAVAKPAAAARVLRQRRVRARDPDAAHGELLDSYAVQTRLTEDGGVFEVVNTAPHAPFVIGDEQQPFHADIGWIQSDVDPVYDDIAAYARDEIENL
ncbi:MAG: 2'-5' RNA ligase family protein [Anaerolineae bacterium]|nr:2'-5' RNA ligase family protein [Anaerolineae bacterium]